MEEITLFEKLLELEPPWQVLNVAASREEKRLDIHLGYKGFEKKSFFGFARKKKVDGGSRMSNCPHCHSNLPTTDQYSPVTVQYTATLGYATYLHIPPSGAVNSSQPDCVCMRTWKKPGTNCSQALYDTAVEMLQTVKDTEKVGKLLNISSSEMALILETADIKGNEPGRRHQKSSARF